MSKINLVLQRLFWMHSWIIQQILVVWSTLFCIFKTFGSWRCMKCFYVLKDRIHSENGGIRIQFPLHSCIIAVYQVVGKENTTTTKFAGWPPKLRARAFVTRAREQKVNARVSENWCTTTWFYFIPSFNIMVWRSL